MIVTKCLVKFNRWATIVTIEDTGFVTCFKFDHGRTHCEYETFWDEYAAVEYILSPLPETEWRVEVDGE